MLFSLLTAFTHTILFKEKIQSILWVSNGFTHLPVPQHWLLQYEVITIFKGSFKAHKKNILYIFKILKDNEILNCMISLLSDKWYISYVYEIYIYFRIMKYWIVWFLYCISSYQGDLIEKVPKPIHIFAFIEHGRNSKSLVCLPHQKKGLHGTVNNYYHYYHNTISKSKSRNAE